MELKEAVEQHWSLCQTVFSVRVKIFLLLLQKIKKKGVLEESLKGNSRMTPNKG